MTIKSGAGSGSGAAPASLPRDVPERQHLRHPRRGSLPEALLGREVAWIAERAEHDVEQRQVAVVVRVHAALVVDRIDRKSTRLNSSHYCESRMPSSA